MPMCHPLTLGAVGTGRAPVMVDTRGKLMEDENSGAQGALEDAQTGQDAQAQAGQEGALSAQVGSEADVDYKGLIEERDRRIAELEAQVAEAAKSAERAEKMGAEIAELREQAKSDRIDFELRLAGVRNVKAARAVLEDHDGDVERLKEAEPWLFSAGGKADDEGESGSTGLPNAGISKEEGLQLKRFLNIAGVDDEGDAE